MQTSNKTSIWLFLISFALVFYGMGASFVESFVNYPTWRLIGANEFRAYHQALGPLVIGYMVIPMLITTILTILLLWFRPAPIPQWAIWLAVVLQLIIWVSTVAIQLPIQVQLSRDGLSLPLIERLDIHQLVVTQSATNYQCSPFLMADVFIAEGEFPTPRRSITKPCS